MAKRFGRNQRRKMRVSISALEMALACEKSFREQSDRRNAEQIKAVKSDALDAIRAARMARDTIRIDVDALLDPMDRRMRITARFDNLNRRGPELYSACAFSQDEMIKASGFERDAFVRLVGEQIAEHALEQIMRQWRSRP